jgi:hypothetical protein
VGFVKPNTGVMVLVDRAEKEISKLTKGDMVIFWEAQMILLEMPLVRDQ